MNFKTLVVMIGFLLCIGHNGSATYNGAAIWQKMPFTERWNYKASIITRLKKIDILHQYVLNANNGNEVIIPHDIYDRLSGFELSEEALNVSKAVVEALKSETEEKMRLGTEIQNALQQNNAEKMRIFLDVVDIHDRKSDIKKLITDYITRIGVKKELSPLELVIYYQGLNPEISQPQFVGALLLARPDATQETYDIAKDFSKNDNFSEKEKRSYTKIMYAAQDEINKENKRKFKNYFDFNLFFTINN